MIKTPWQILNIPGNSDERAIKRAYAQALKALDPDDREGFIALREAYEAALAKLQEYRSALISHAVTGKIDIRSLATSKEL